MNNMTQVPQAFLEKRHTLTTTLLAFRKIDIFVRQNNIDLYDGIWNFYYYISRSFANVARERINMIMLANPKEDYSKLIKLNIRRDTF